MTQAIKIAKDVYWVGAIDWDVRDFHGYKTEQGSSYNAYLILDEKITLIDCVKPGFEQQLLDRIASVIDPKKIDIIISNHSEPDHSGSLPVLRKMLPNAKLYTAQGSGIKDLSGYYGDLKYEGVKAGGSLNIGKRTLQFVPTPMVHWPDNMVTYMTPDNILFSNDAFGQHYASYAMLDTQNNLGEVFHQAKKYYANIVQPYVLPTQKALEVVNTLNVSMVCPSHGIIWTKHFKEILKLYHDWTTSVYDNTASIIYDTMWRSTEMMAQAIADGYLKAGLTPKLFNLRHYHISDVIAETMQNKYMAFGSPTLNRNMLPTVASFMTYFSGLNGFEREVVIFGSYGWSGQSVPHIEEIALKSNCKLALPVIQLQYKPSREQLEEITKNVAASVLKAK